MINNILGKADYLGLSIDSRLHGMTIYQLWRIQSGDFVCMLTLNNKLGLWWD